MAYAAYHGVEGMADALKLITRGNFQGHIQIPLLHLIQGAYEIVNDFRLFVRHLACAPVDGQGHCQGQKSHQHQGHKAQLDKGCTVVYDLYGCLLIQHGHAVRVIPSVLQMHHAAAVAEFLHQLAPVVLEPGHPVGEQPVELVNQQYGLFHISQPFLKRICFQHKAAVSLEPSVLYHGLEHEPCRKGPSVYHRIVIDKDTVIFAVILVRCVPGQIISYVLYDIGLAVGGKNQIPVPVKQVIVTPVNLTVKEPVNLRHCLCLIGRQSLKLFHVQLPCHPFILVHIAVYNALKLPGKVLQHGPALPDDLLGPHRCKHQKQDHQRYKARCKRMENQTFPDFVPETCLFSLLHTPAPFTIFNINTLHNTAVFSLSYGSYIVTSLLPDTLKKMSRDTTVVTVRMVARAAAVP